MSEEAQAPPQEDLNGYSLPIWIWGTAAFIAGYMMLQLQTYAA